MQHKSLFAALLCGTLCLTACLKNEESPSVTTVRLAKATELESIAARNNADAYAIKTLADANAALLLAQAKLEEARVKVQEAEAEKTKAETAKILVEAELQQVNVDLAKVVLEEEKVKLEAKKAELEKLKAEYAAAIAEAESNKIFWENRKQLLAKDLEAALIRAEADLIQAQMELVMAQAALDQAIRDAEKAAHDAENAANQQAAQELEDLRNKVLELSAKYYSASLDLLDIEEDLLHEQAQITKAENDIITVTELKNEEIEYNNREIARLEKCIEYLETYATLDPEDIKDALVDMVFATNEQYNVMRAAYNDYMAVYNQMAGGIPNQTGLEDDSPLWDVTYSYTQEFFKPEAGEPAVATLSDIPTDWVSDNDYASASIKTEIDTETNISHVIMTKYSTHVDWDTYTSESNEEEYELYSYYNDGGDWGVKKETKRYPELGEGIAYEKDPNAFTYDTYEFIPMEINREGYEEYVNVLNAQTEDDRAVDIWYLEDEYQTVLDGFNNVKDRIQQFVDTEKPVAEKVEENINKVIEKFIEDWEGAKKLYDEFAEAEIAYYQKYENDNVIERSEAWKAVLDAKAPYDKAVSDYNDVLASKDVSVLNANIKTAETKVENAEKAKADFYNNAGSDYKTNEEKWNEELHDQKYILGLAEYLKDVAQKDYEDAADAYNAAVKAYNTQKEKADEAEAAYYKALQAEADAYVAWAQAGGKDPSPEKTTYDNAVATKNSAKSTYDTEMGKLAPLESDMAAKEGTMKTNEKTLSDLKKAYDDQVKIIEEIAAIPGSYDKAIADANAELAAAKKALTDYETEVNDAKAKVEAAKADLQKAFDAWKAIASDADEIERIWGKDGLEDKYLEAVKAIGDPVAEVLWTYGLISYDPNVASDTTLDDYLTSDSWWTYDSEATYFDTIIASFSWGMTEESLYEYVDNLIEAAGYAYYSSRPSTAWVWYDDYIEYIDEYGYYANLPYDWDDYDNFLDYAEGNLWSWDEEDVAYNYYQLSALGLYYVYNDFAAWLDYFDGFEEAFEEYKNKRIDAINEYYDDEIAENNKILDKVDAVLANEAVYKNAIDELNTLAAKIPELYIAYMLEYQKYIELENEYASVRYDVLDDVLNLEEEIKQLKEDIAKLEEDNADWETITEMQHALTKLEGKYALDQEMYEVAKAIVESYKAEYDAAFAELKATLE